MLLWICKVVTENTDPDKYKYCGYGIGFDPCSEFSFTNGSTGKNVVIFGADLSSSMHIDNKNKDFSALSEGPTQGLDDTILTVEANKYPINFTQSGKKIVLSLHYNGSNSFLLMLQKYISSKQKTPKQKIVQCLGNVSKGFT